MWICFILPRSSPAFVEPEPSLLSADVRAAILKGGELSDGVQDTATGPNDMCNDDTVQPTISEILHAVQKCTTSVDDLKERFDGLGEEVSLLRQDLQKIRERVTTVKI